MTSTLKLIASNWRDWKDQIKRKAIQTYHDLLPDPCLESLTIKAFNTLSERYRLATFLTYGSADDDNDLIWLDDDPESPNSVLIGYQLSPLIKAGEKSTYQLEKLLNDNQIPAGTIFSSYALASNNIEGFCENWSVSRKNNHSAVFDAITKRRVKHLIDWAHGRKKPMSLGSQFQPRVTQHYLFIRIPASFTTYNVENVNAFIEKVNHIHHSIVAKLDATHMPSRRLSGSAMAKVAKEMINLHMSTEDIRETGINVDQSLAEQIAPPDCKQIIDKEGYIHFSSTTTGQNKVAAVMTVNKYAKSKAHFLSEMQKCIGSVEETDDIIPGNFYAFSILEKQDRTKRLKDVVRKVANVEWHTSVENRVFQQIFRRHHEMKATIYDYLDKIKNGKGAFKAISGIVVSGNDKKAVMNACERAQTAWLGANLELVRETAIAAPMWLASFPGRYIPSMDGVSQGLQRGVSMSALNAATLMHVQGDWTGSHPIEGGLLGLTRRGNLSVLNFFKTFKANFNALIAASSGSGKSFLMADFLADFLTRGGIVRGIDAGRSYYNLVDILGGQNVVCEKDSPLCFNLFSTMKTRDMLDEALDTLTRLVAQMCFPSGYEACDEKGLPWEESVIKDAIVSAWERKRDTMNLMDVYQTLQQALKQGQYVKDDQRLKDILQILGQWVKGPHAKWFMGTWNIEFDDPLMVFELDELRASPALQNIILNIILAKITDEMYCSYKTDKALNKGEITPKIIFLDEAWDLLSRPFTARFIEEAARRVRKYYGSIVIITQAFTDMGKNSASEAFVQNSNWILSLMQDIGTVKKAMDDGLINLGDYAVDLIDTLHKTNHYSEIYALNKSLKGEGVYRLVVDPYSYYTYTTDAQEKARVNQLVKSGKSISEAIALITDEQYQEQTKTANANQGANL